MFAAAKGTLSVEEFLVVVKGVNGVHYKCYQIDVTLILKVEVVL